MNWIELVDRIIGGGSLSSEEAFSLAAAPENALWDMMQAADRIRRHFHGNKIHTCTILNGKSGHCSENCAYCAQSRVAKNDVQSYPLLSGDVIGEHARAAVLSGVDRFSLVTSGRALPKSEVRQVAEVYRSLPKAHTQYCGSLGILGKEELQTLFEAGITRCHHNLETARSHFAEICTSHTYDERVRTLKEAKAVGMSLCCGGLFGIGETDAQVVELALDIRAIGVEAIPVNFLMPIPGTPLEKEEPISPRRCLKIIALFRLINPLAEILVCGGREGRLGELHPLIFGAGASGIMTGNYLTCSGRSMEADVKMLDALGFEHGLLLENRGGLE